MICKHCKRDRDSAHTTPVNGSRFCLSLSGATQFEPAEPAAGEPPKPEHICGLEGYGAPEDPVCPACLWSRKRAERGNQPQDDKQQFQTGAVYTNMRATIGPYDGKGVVAEPEEPATMAGLIAYLRTRLQAAEEQNCKMQDEVAEIVSSHRSDWSWQDVLSDVRRAAALPSEGAVARVVAKNHWNEALWPSYLTAARAVLAMLKGESK